MTAPASSVEISGIVKKGPTWVSAKASERAVVLQSYAADPKFKKYVQQVEKCLNSFDNVHEWADCISFLKQLLKTFQAYTQFKEIPRKLIVAKRLAQCLNPALPTGVHTRALEVYVHILSVLDSEGLKRDLSLWSSGLFPFFQYAATSVKPSLLSVYETHYLPLQFSLRPIMRSFILALLPGLEEETGEFFDKVINLLEKLSKAISMSFFFQNVWLVMLTTPSARGTSLNFLSRRLPRFETNEDIADVVGKDIGLMIRAFAAALEDENLLVRRAALDILLQTMRVNSFTMQKAQTDDRAILMRAATGVVLRRDLSLNRRLFTWLLGTDEKSEAQIQYLKSNTLGLLKSTLKHEMFSPSGEYAESRPFKIFISLLDKWEIGGPLTEVLVYDSFKAIKQLVQTGMGNGDLTMTAGTLYEAVEPHILWKCLFSALIASITESGADAESVHLTRFILKTFPHDEEIQSIHLPVVFAGVMDLLYSEIVSNPFRTASESVCEVLRLLEDMLQQVTKSGLLRRPKIEGTCGSRQRPFEFACAFYKVTTKASIKIDSTVTTNPSASCFDILVSMNMLYAEHLCTVKEHGSALREPFCRTLALVSRLVTQLTTPLDVSWNPDTWLGQLLLTFQSKHATFTTVDQVITSALDLHHSQQMPQKPPIQNQSNMCRMISRLLKYLRPHLTSYHVRAVNLIWSLESSTSLSHVETILAQAMNSPESAEAYEAFGVLWRLTEDTLLPGLHFKVPMMTVLDSLTSENPSLRRIGETWMRCSLKSYIRILEPILYDLLEPSIQRTSTTFKVRGRELLGFVYERPFDQRILIHLLETLLSVVSFGGQGFTKAAKAAVIKRSSYGGLVQRLSSAGLVDPEADCLDVLIESLLRILQSEPKASLVARMQPLNIVAQSNAIDVLQAILSRGEIDTDLLEGIEALTISKLYLSIHTGQLDLQNKWLHLLHSIISLSTSHSEVFRPGSSSDDDAGPETATVRNKNADSTSRYSLNPLLIPVLMDGISLRSNRPVLQHWLDFVLMAIPQIQPALQAVVGPLIDCLCRQILQSLAELLRAASHTPADDDSATISDSEMIMLLNALERLLLLSLTYFSEADHSEDQTTEKQAESTGLLGYVSTVFSSEGTSNQAEQLTPRSPGYQSLHDGIRVLYSTWVSLIWKAPPQWRSKDYSLATIYNKTRLRCRRVLEHLFRVQSTGVFECVVDRWSWDQNLSASSPDAAFELIDVLLSNAQNSVHICCESISIRLLGSPDKNKKQAINQNLSDATLFKFLEQYLQRLEGPLASQVWGRFSQLVKDILTGYRDFKPHHFAVLRCLGVLAEKIIQSPAIEDRKVRKELQDYFGKLLDACVVYVGRSTDQGSWIRRTTKDTILSTSSGWESPAGRSDHEKAEPIPTGLPMETSRSLELTGQIISFVAESVLPYLKRLLVENDKVIGACNNIVYYIVSPTMRGKTRPMDVDPYVMQSLQEMTRIPAALKSWRTPVIDMLTDNRLFNCTPDDARKWRPIVRSLYDADKTAFPELLAKAAAAPSTNIFATKDYEMLLRSLNLRRLSYAIFTAEKNHFLTQLPTIQEKLVDVFRNVPAAVVQSEVFLCIRVLLCRLSPNNLTSFWPVVLTEMHRILEQVITTIPADGSDDLQLLLAVCKCLDTLLVLQAEEFQMFQWIFITDTVDAIYRPNDWHPEAMLDQLAEIVAGLPIEDASKSKPLDHPIQNAARPMRRPLLGSIKRIDAMGELAAFLSHVSISSYESVYASGGNIDWEAVEKSILDDMFDGR